jgi:hypothetical protein
VTHCTLCALELDACLCPPSTPNVESSRRTRLSRRELEQIEAAEARAEQLERGRARVQQS